MGALQTSALKATDQIRMGGRLLDVFCDPGHETVPILEVGIEVGLVDDGAGLRLDAGLLVRQRQLVQHLHVRQRVRERDLLLGHRGPGCDAVLEDAHSNAVHNGSDSFTLLTARTVIYLGATRPAMRIRRASLMHVAGASQPIALANTVRVGHGSVMKWIFSFTALYSPFRKV